MCHTDHGGSQRELFKWLLERADRGDLEALENDKLWEDGKGHDGHLMSLRKPLLRAPGTDEPTGTRINMVFKLLRRLGNSLRRTSLVLEGLKL